MKPVKLKLLTTEITCLYNHLHDIFKGPGWGGEGGGKSARNTFKALGQILPTDLEYSGWKNTQSVLIFGINPSLYSFESRAIAQAVSRRLSTAAARVRAKVRSCEICGGKSGTGAGFLRVLWFPLPILIPPTAPHLSSIIRGWYNRPVSGRRTKWTQSHPTPRDLKKTSCFRKSKGGDARITPPFRLPYHLENF
jgi:hypothetical protein